MSSLIRAANVAFSLVTSFATLACVDPQKTFDEFGDRVVDAGAGTQLCTEFFPVDGEFLLSIQTAAPNPIRFIATVATTVSGAGGTADLSVQPVVAACTGDMAGEPVGDPVDVTDIAIDEGGNFDVAATGVAVPGAANAVLCGMDIVADIQLLGCTRSEELICGDVDGTAMVGSLMVPLSGSTFGATKLAMPGVYGDANLPEPVVECP